MDKYTSRVAEIIELNETVKLFHLELVEPHRIEFKAGQYVEVELAGGEESKEYSIASIPELDHGVQLVVNVTESGEAARYFGELKAGAEVRFAGPKGEFYVQENNEQGLVFIANGMGIVAVRSMILDLLEVKRETRQIWLYWGLTYMEEMFWEEELHQWREEKNNFTLDIVLSKPPFPEWKLCSGGVEDCIRQHHQQFENTSFYISGDRTMIDDMERYLKGKGVRQEVIYRQRVA